MQTRLAGLLKRLSISSNSILLITFLAILSCSKTDPVEQALIDYHKSKGQDVDISSLEYRKVSSGIVHAEDSEFAEKMASICINAAKGYTSIGDKKSIYRAAEILSRADSFDRISDSLKTLADIRSRDSTYLQCDYIFLVGGSERYTDTASVILNDSMRVVFRYK